MTGIIILIIVAGFVARMLITATQGAGEGRELASRDAQIRQLRGEMDALQSEVRRLSEEQSFTMRLLAGGQDQPGGALPAPGPETHNPETR